MTIFQIQSTFQFGEISDLLFARSESPIYYRSARELRNVVVIPQGGVKVRFGTTFVAAVPNSITDYTLIKPLIMDYEDGTRYLMIFSNTKIDIYKNDALVKTVTGTPYAGTDIPGLSVSQSSNLLFITHAIRAPTILSRPTDDTSWILNTAVFTNYPTYDFNQDYDTFTFTVLVGGVAIVTGQNILGQVVTLNSSGNAFNANHKGGLYFGAGGTIRITAYTSATSVVGRIVKIFDSSSTLFNAPNNISGADSVLTEIAFSSIRGYPQKVNFFQNRVFYGRTASLLGGLFGSNYNAFNATTINFDDSEAFDTNALSTIITGKRAVLITHMVPYKSLLILTTSGLYSTPLLEDFPLTPTNASYINLQTADSSSETEPQILDNQVIFIDKGGKKIKDVNLISRTGTYATNNISVLSPHLIDQPNSTGVYENSTTEDGTWLMMTMNGNTLDGGLSIYQSVPEQQITAWTYSTTDGKFRYVVADEDLVYFIVERTINGATALYIEKLDWTVRTDCATVTTTVTPPSVNVSGLTHLIGKTVRVIGDGAVMQSQVVSNTGTITLERAVTNVQVGLNFNPTIIPMPLLVPTQQGNNIYLPKTVKKIYVDYNQSLGITVNGTTIPSLTFNVDTYGNPVAPKTDFFGLSSFNGWNPRQEFIISQNDPLPFTVIGIGFEAEQ